MHFKGQLLLPTEPGPGLSVDLEVAGHHLALVSDKEELGAWPLETIRVRRLRGDTFAMTVAGEDLHFVADDTISFAYSGVPAISQVGGRSRSRSPLRTLLGLFATDAAGSPDAGVVTQDQPPAKTEELQPSREDERPHEDDPGEEDAAWSSWDSFFDATEPHPEALARPDATPDSSPESRGLEPDEVDLRSDPGQNTEGPTVDVPSLPPLLGEPPREAIPPIGGRQTTETSPVEPVERVDREPVEQHEPAERDEPAEWHEPAERDEPAEWHEPAEQYEPASEVTETQKCRGLRADGLPCESTIIGDSGYCYPHDPDHELGHGFQKAREARARLKSKGTDRLARVYKRLDKALRQVERGELDPEKAIAMAQLAHTMCAILDLDEPEPDDTARLLTPETDPS